jgi:acetylornithine deacetylase/succinyl-diaminopimelate desuccinylase-like protein
VVADFGRCSGSRADIGIDAVANAGYFLVELHQYAQRLQQLTPPDPAVGPPSVHASIIKGGEEASSYPALCTIVIERRTVAGETPNTVKQEIQDLLEGVARKISLKFDIRVTFHRPSFTIPLNHPFASLVGDAVSSSLGRRSTFKGEAIW